MSHPRAAMSRADYACALGVVIIWGLNFAIMKYALVSVTPMLLGLLRYVAASLPLIAFVPMPRVPLRYIVGYGLIQGVGQFGFLFVAIHLGMAAGVASLVLQTQALFTVLLAAAFLGERPRAVQWLGLLLAMTGLGLIAATHGEGPGQMTLIGFVLTLMAALMWALSNLLVRQLSTTGRHYDAFGFIVWTSLMAVPPFLLLTLVFEGAAPSWQVMHAMSWGNWGAVIYLSLVSTLVGYTLWTRLLKRHPSSRVAPFSLLVPVVGLATAAITFGERLTTTQWLGAVGVLVGLLINQFGDRVLRLVRGSGQR